MQTQLLIEANRPNSQNCPADVADHAITGDFVNMPLLATGNMWYPLVNKHSYEKTIGKPWENDGLMGFNG